MINDESSEGAVRIHRKRVQRTRRVLAAGMKLVERHGLAGFTLADLASELDYSAPALYRYFPSKDALVAELQRTVVDMLARDSQLLVGRCEQWCEHNSSSPELARLLPLVSIAVYYDRFAHRAPELFGLLSLGLGSPERMLDDERAGIVVASAEEIFAGLASLFEAASASGCLQPGEAMPRAVVLWATLQGVVQLRKISHLSPDTFDCEKLFVTAVHTLLEGWGAQRGAVTRALEAATHSELFEVVFDPGFEAATAISDLSLVAES